MEKGLVHIYCGDGKGKTTAAVGLAVRVAGSGLAVAFAQFLKSNTSSERKSLAALPGVTLIDGPDEMKFTKFMSDNEFKAAKEYFGRMFEQCRRLSQSPDTDVLILDEVFGAVSCGILTNAQVAQLIKERADNVELVLTGRNPAEEIVALADYVTEMKLVKHPYKQGVPARKGIEF